MVRHYTPASSQRSRWQVSDLCKQGRVQEALLEYEARPHPIGAVALLNAIKAASGLSDKTNLERALHVWSVLSKRASTQTPSEELPNVQVFGALIATCCHFGDRSLALKFFELMDSYQVKPNSQCFGILANACAKAGDTKIARMLLNQIMDNKLLFSPNEIDCVQLAMAFCKGVPPELEAALRLFDWVTKHAIALKSSTLHTVLLDGCAIGRDLALAMRVFEHFQQIFARRSAPADIRTVGAMLKVYGNCGQHIKALELLDRMESDFGLAPNERCFGLVAQACTQAEDGSTTAKELLARVMDNKLPLIPSGPQCTQLAQALSSSPTTLASAVQLFDWARSRKVDLTSAIATVILKGCTQWVAANLGRQFYANIHALYGNNWDDRVDGALVSFFGKCGTIAEAREVFDNARKAQTALSIHVWTAMLGVYGQRGQGRAALQLFGEMVQSGIKPDSVTLIAALNACSHAGLIDEALDLARSMQNQWGIQLDTAQGTCVVDALARAGRLEEAESFALQLANPDEATWRALLGACRGYRSSTDSHVPPALAIAKRTAERIWKLNPRDPATFVVLASIHAMLGDHDAEATLRAKMQTLSIKKIPGQTWIEHGGKVHTFTSGQQCTETVAKELERLKAELKRAGYLPDIRWVTWDEEDAEKAERLCYHSEKLAIAFGLAHTAPGTPLLLRKNLRVCPDCHAATKLIAKIRKREIEVWDANRHHHFHMDGTCSCNDYW